MRRHHSRPLRDGRRSALGTRGKFDGLPDLVPALVARGTTVGEGIDLRRILQIRGGGSVAEELISLDSENFRFTNAIKDLEGQPWEHYFCNVQLKALGPGQTHLAFTGNFPPRGGLGVAYGPMFGGLARTLGVSLKLQPA